MSHTHTCVLGCHGLTELRLPNGSAASLRTCKPVSSQCIHIPQLSVLRELQPVGTSGIARGAVWYSPMRKEAMAEIRLF